MNIVKKVIHSSNCFDVKVFFNFFAPICNKSFNEINLSFCDIADSPIQKYQLDVPADFVTKIGKPNFQS